MYASYAGGDENLVSVIGQMSGESSWVDGVWDTAALSGIAAEQIGGKNFKKTSYSHEIPDISKRNQLMVRLGGNGIEYTGDVYVTNIKLDNTALAIGDIDQDVLSGSYGDGLAGIQVSTFDGMDALLSTVQMPPGIPVATVAVDAGVNAALLSAQILAVEDTALADKLRQLKDTMRQGALDKDAALQSRKW